MPSSDNKTEPPSGRCRSMPPAGLATVLATAVALGLWLTGCTQSTPTRTIVVQGAAEPSAAEATTAPDPVAPARPDEPSPTVDAAAGEEALAEAPIADFPTSDDAAVEDVERRQFSLPSSTVLGTRASPPTGGADAEEVQVETLAMPPGMFDPPPDAEAQPVGSARRVLEGRRPGAGSGAADGNPEAAETAADSPPGTANATQEDTTVSEGAATALSMLAAFSPDRTTEEPPSPVLIPLDAPPDLALSIDDPVLPPAPPSPIQPVAVQGPVGEVGPRPETGPAPQPVRHDDDVIRQGPWSVVCYQDNAVVFEHDRIYRVWRAEEQPPQWAYETIDGIRFRGRMGTDLNCTFRRS